MKNRKVIVTAFLLIAVMILGVGYAAVSDSLNFTGDAMISKDQAQHEFDADIKIVAVSEDNVTWSDFKADGAEIDRANDLIVDIFEGSGDNVQDIVDFQIYNLSDAGETQTIWFKVKNESAHDANLTGTDITESGSLVGADHFGSEYTVYAADGTTVTQVIPANGEVLVKLVVTLKSTPSETYTANFSFTINAKVGTEAEGE